MAGKSSAVKTSISLDKHFETFIRGEVESGRYATASEVVRDALRGLEKKRLRNAAIAKALIEGEESGFEEGDLVGDVRKELGLE